MARSLVVLAASLIVSVAAAQQPCRLEGKSYPENSVVCSRGIVLYCSNGTWQGNDGQRCDAGNGSYLTPLRPYQPKSNEPIPDYYKEKYPWLHLP